MELTPDMLQILLASGRAFSFTPEGGLVVDASESALSAKEKRSERNRRYQERLKTSQSVLDASETSDLGGDKPPPLPLPSSLPLPPQTPPSPAHLPAPTPAHNARTREEAGKFSLETPDEPKPKRKTPESADDETWLTELAANPLYAGLNLRLELAKMQVWCQTNRCLSSRRRFVNWINKAERGLIAPPEPLTRQQKVISGWFGRREDEPWGADELALWRQIQPIHPDDWQALEWFYAVATGDKRLCQSLRALLSKWRSEIDRAKNYNPDQK